MAAPTKQVRDFARRLTVFRERSGYGQRAIGEALGVSQSLVSYWECATYVPEPALVFKLEKVLQLEPGTLSATLGYMPLRNPSSIIEAIEGDLELDEDSKSVLLHTYTAVAAQGRFNRNRPRRGRIAG